MNDRTATLLDQVREARAASRRLQVVGAGSKPWMATRATAGEQISLAGHTGIISYDPAELVVTVRSGTRLHELEQTLARRGQMLIMEAPDFNGGSTVGGMVALGWAGSRSAFVGGVRDAVLGLRMINGLGEDLRFGGQVMKNVAGFDISRLMVGSLGRLGVILEVSLRVAPLPQREITLQWPAPDLAGTRAMVEQWTRQGYPVSGASFGNGLLNVRFSGGAAMIEEIRQALDGMEVDGSCWRDLQTLELPLFHHGWGDEKLFDCNGQVCWTAHTRRRGDGPAVSLAQGPSPANQGSGLSLLRQRVHAAFDPASIFQVSVAGNPAAGDPAAGDPGTG